MHSGLFSWLDYGIFMLSLGIPVLTGVYFGFIKKKQNSTKEYLYGIEQITLIPISMSLYSSSTSSNVILGIPMEIYVFGGVYCSCIIGYIITIALTWICILPVYCGTLTFSSPYEYIELRFNYTARCLTTALYVVHTLLYQPVILYTSTLTFSEATGIPLVTCIVVVGGFCVFYTAVGGFSSVIWTDTLQGATMFFALLFVVFWGASEVGGWSEVWRRAKQGQRLEIFSTDLNPFVRISTASSIVGMGVWHLGHAGCTATALQRYMALASEKQARISAVLCNAGAGVALLLSSLIGWTMYAFYQHCDPVASNKVDAYNKMVPYYIAHIVKNVSGLFGLFTAGILCAGLSTISAEMNTVGGLIYHDIIERLYKKPISNTRGAFIMKIIVFIVGVLYVAIAPIFAKATYIITLIITIAGITYGAKIGVLILGSTFPKCNSKGVICGMIAGLLTMMWIGFSARYYDVFASYKLPMSTDNCSTTTNSTTFLQNVTTYLNDDSKSPLTTVQPLVVSEPFILYKLSIMYYAAFGMLTTIVVAMFISYLTGFNDVNKMDPRLVIPYLRPTQTRNIYTLTDTK